MNTIFRNEGAGIASEMIREAIAASIAFYGEPPPLGIVTFIDRKKVKPTMQRGQPTWGYCYQKAGFKYVGETKGHLMVWQLLPSEMPEPKLAHGQTPTLTAPKENLWQK